MVALGLLYGAPALDSADGDGDGEVLEGILPFPVPVPRLDRRPVVPRIIYMNREGAHLVAGTDNSFKNISSIVENADLETADVPAFRGSARTWDRIVACVRAKFEPYEVEVVDQRPTDRGYIMAVVGGTHDVVEGGGHSHGAVSGLAPFNSQTVEDPVVLVFSRTMRERVRATCEVAAMEVAHAYGLDHSRHCGEIMSYNRPCRARDFMDRDLPCGEHEDRVCGDGEATQNSHRALLAVLGPRGGGAPVQAKE